MVFTPFGGYFVGPFIPGFWAFCKDVHRERLTISYLRESWLKVTWIQGFQFLWISTIISFFMCSCDVIFQSCAKVHNWVIYNIQGKISVDDIQRIAKDLGETFTIDEIKEMVQEADQNGKPPAALFCWEINSSSSITLKGLILVIRFSNRKVFWFVSDPINDI